jgi:hypothetical protein
MSTKRGEMKESIFAAAYETKESIFAAAAAAAASTDIKSNTNEIECILY